jgi:hypothetical protein
MLMTQKPSNYDLLYIIRYTDLKQAAWEMLMTQKPSNYDLLYIIEYTDLKQAAAEMLRVNVGVLEPIDEPALIKNIAEHVLAAPNGLHMGDWHCGTAHCLAGWATVLNTTAQAIEQKTDTETAGCIALPSYAHLFFSDNETVLQVLKDVAANSTT